MIFLVAGFAAIFPTRHIGFSEVVKNGESEMSVRSDPILFIWAAMAVVLFAVLMGIRSRTVTVGIPTLKRRAAAFFIDFWFSMTTVTTASALVPLWLEIRRTGRFPWHFERDYSVGSDAFILPLVLLEMAVVFLYFALPLTKGKQTVGCFVMRLRVVPPFGDYGRFTFRESLRRTAYELWGLLTWKWATKDFLDDRGGTWWDRETNCSVVLVQPELKPPCVGA